MGHKRGSIVHEFTKAYESMVCFGESKHEVKKTTGDYTGKIFGSRTFKNYLNCGIRFGQYCKSVYGCRTVIECRQYVEDYLQFRSEHLSSWTVKKDASALAKLYRCHTYDFAIRTPARIRSDITRSRGRKNMDYHFSEKRNADLVTFCQGTGLRRSELTALRGDQLVLRDSKFYIYIQGNQGKGGKERYVPIIGDVKRIVDMMVSAGSDRVFSKVHAAADIHSYRAYYAMQVYKYYERHGAALNRPFIDPHDKHFYKNALYRCRKDKAGTVYDKYAMLMASRALGHNRIDVIAEHYLWQLGEEYSVVADMLGA